MCYMSLITHQPPLFLIGHVSVPLYHCEDCSLANPDSRRSRPEVFMFISVVYVNTVTAWSNGPCNSLFSPFYPTYLSSFFFCFFLFFLCLFLTTASWNRSGRHPRSLTGQCTSHNPLLSFFWTCLFSLLKHSCGFIAPLVHLSCVTSAFLLFLYYDRVLQPHWRK